MIKLEDIYNFIDSIAPFESAMDFDNVGLLVGNIETEVCGVLVALDVTKEVIKEAQLLGANVIVTHHPVIFKALKSLRFDSLVSTLIKKDICVICAHTNLDIAENGVNSWLSSKLMLNSVTKMSQCGTIGYLEKEFNGIKEFASFVCDCLNAKSVRYTDIDRKIKKVAVCSGSGGDFVYEAASLSADAFVTGEIKHSQILLANELKMPVVDAGHFKTENVFCNPFVELLKSKFSTTKFFVSKACDDKINFI